MQSIDIKQILALPADERDVEIRKLIVPGPWRHEWDTCGRNALNKCQKCGKPWASSSNAIKRNFSCPIPDPIALDWNLAKKMQAECDDEKIFEEALFQVWKTMVNKGNYYLWHLCTAQPQDYLVAALVVGKKK